MRFHVFLALLLFSAAASGCVGIDFGDPPDPPSGSMIIGYFKPEAFMELGKVEIQAQGPANFLFGCSVEAKVLPSGYYYALGVKPGRYVIMSVSENGKISHKRSHTFTVSYIPRKERFWSYEIPASSVCYAGAYSLSSFPLPFRNSSINHISEHPTIDKADVIGEILPLLEGSLWHELLARDLGNG